MINLCLRETSNMYDLFNTFIFNTMLVIKNRIYSSIFITNVLALTVVISGCRAPDYEGEPCLAPVPLPPVQLVTVPLATVPLEAAAPALNATWHTLVARRDHFGSSAVTRAVTPASSTLRHAPTASCRH